MTSSPKPGPDEGEMGATPTMMEPNSTPIAMQNMLPEMALKRGDCWRITQSKFNSNQAKLAGGAAGIAAWYLA